MAAKRGGDGSESDDDGFIIAGGRKRGEFPSFPKALPADVRALTSMDVVARRKTQKSLAVAMKIPPPAERMPPLPGAKHRRDTNHERSVAALAYRRANSMPDYDYPTKKAQLEAALAAQRAHGLSDIERKTTWKTKAGQVPGVPPRAATSMSSYSDAPSPTSPPADTRTPVASSRGSRAPKALPPLAMPPNDASLGVFQANQPYDFKRWQARPPSPPKDVLESAAAVTAVPGSVKWQRQMKELAAAQRRCQKTPS